MAVFLWIFLISVFTQIFAMVLANKYKVCIDEPVGKKKKKHKTHKHAVPRIGGLGIVLGFLAGIYFFKLDYLAIWVLISVFALGFWEDARGNLKPRLRLHVIAAFGLAIMLIMPDSIIGNIGFPLPLWLAVPFTIFAFTGLTNSINIIDGVNGLSSAIAIIGFGFLGMEAFLHNDIFLAKISCIIAVSLLGFFVFNFPKAKIFLGDGGAYFTGFAAAVTSALLISGNTQISPWFPVVIFAYPIVDTLFSMYRRKFVSRRSAMSADKLHLHILINKRISKFWTLFFILPFVLIFNIAGAFLYSNTVLLIALFCVFVLLYLYSYNMIVNFGFQGKLKRKLGRNVN